MMRTQGFSTEFHCTEWYSCAGLKSSASPPPHHHLIVELKSPTEPPYQLNAHLQTSSGGSITMMQQNTLSTAQ